MNYNFKDIINLCLANQVDFEVFYGNVLNKGIRVGAIINLEPAVRVDFGDKRHGELVSRIHLSDNHRVNMSVNALVDAILKHDVDKDWRIQATTEKNSDAVVASVFKSATDNHVSVDGTITHVGERVLNGDNSRFDYKVAVRQYIRTIHSDEITELPMVTVDCVIEGTEEWVTQMTNFFPGVGHKTYSSGEYVHPNILKVHFHGSSLDS